MEFKNRLPFFGKEKSEPELGRGLSSIAFPNFTPVTAGAKSPNLNQTNNITINAGGITSPEKIVEIIKREQNKWTKEVITDASEFNREN